MSALNRLVAAGLVCLLVGVMGLPLSGSQAVRDTGSIVGTVTDQSQGALPGVTVVVSSPVLVQPRRTVTSVTGAYRVDELPPGRFTVTFSLAGFQTAAGSAVITGETPAVRVDQAMVLAAMAESITVNTGMIMVQTVPTLIATGDTARYAGVEPNTFRETALQPRSTFGADVDTASYTNVRRFLNEGRLPPVEAVRVEEFLNYFRFDYAAPDDGRPVAITSEVGACPWAPAHKLVLVGARARLSPESAAPRNLVFLVDVSGSMMSADRLPLLKTALSMFVDTLRPTDEISIVTYAGDTAVRLPPTPARHRDRILDAIAGLGASGSTNGGAGLRLAYELARGQYVKGGVNRVILATDGDFNVGVTSRDDLYQLIDREKQSGVFLSVLGVGTHNLQDATMEMLADKGNGHYAYLDTLQEALRVLVREGGSTLETVAKDVKFQVEFNPAEVQAWKLIGYENRLLAEEDFKDDRKDGGELGAGHTVTVLYEVVPVGAPRPSEMSQQRSPSVDPLIYQSGRRLNPAAARRDLMTVGVRYKLPEGDRSDGFNLAVPAGGRNRHLPLASAVAEFGLMLRDDRTSQPRWDGLVTRARALAASGADPAGERAGFVQMVELAAALSRLSGTRGPSPLR